MTDKSKQVAPPFAPNPAHQNQGWPKEEPPVQKDAEQMGVLATLFDAPAEGTVSEPQASESSGVKPVVQTQEEAAGNVEEYWSSGTIGGLALGNRSGAAPKLFGEKPMGEKNPFGADFGKVVEPEPTQELYMVPEGTPSWKNLVAFVCTYGKDIQCVQYPNPPMSREIMKLGKGWSIVIDTLWRGVPVVNAERCMIQHVKHGWASWEDCTS